MVERPAASGTAVAGDHWSRQLAGRLARRRQDDLYRQRLTLSGPQSTRVTIDGRVYLAFCSNDYLGLAGHPELIRALQRGAEHYGVGAGASHLVNGHSTPHQALEEELAEFVGAPRALVFSTGYMANLGLAGALLRRGDLLLEDRLNHASMIDAGLGCRARMRRYPHGDADTVRRWLMQAPESGKLIMTDAVFSMDGDLAPVAELVAAAHRHDARVVFDDAHGLGVLGAHGRGTLEHVGQRVTPPVILMATLGKALGTFGAFVAADPAVIETLVQEARTYIYTTAPPPAVAEATRAALRLVAAEGWRREQLRVNVRRFRSGAAQLGLALLPSPTPIQPLVLGSARRALAASDALRRAGILVPAIRPPTVPPGTARLRVTLCAEHTDADVDCLLQALASAVRTAGEVE